MRYVLAAFLLILALAAPALASDFLLAGPITHVRDGDTIVVAGQPVRLKGIAAPERRDPGGPAATAQLASLVGRQVLCHLTGETSHDRLVGWCSLLGEDLGDMMLAASLVRRCDAFDPGHRYPDPGDGPAATLPWPAYCKAKR